MKRIALLITLILLTAFVGGYWFNSQNSDTSLGAVAFTNNSLCRTASASSSPTVIATTTTTATITCDAYHPDTSIYESTTFESAALAIQFTAASTTASTLKYVVTYSQDGSDYYSGENYVASSTLTNATTNRTNYLVNVPTPTRYTKVVFSNTATDATIATSTIWAELIPKREINK